MIEQKENFRVKEMLVEGGDKAIFIFTAMGTKIGLYRLFMSMMRKRGYSVVVYDYPMRSIQSGDLDVWRLFYKNIIDDAQGRLAKFKAGGVTNFYSYGISMGTLVANKFARDTPEISHVVLNMTYGDVADNIWTYKGVKKAKMNIVANGLDIDDLRKNIVYTDPIHNATALKGKKVLLYLAKRDRVLRYDQTKETLRAFREAGLQMEYVENKFLGHFATGAKNLLQVKRLEKFLNT